jgi:hypothetical protein
VQDHSLLIVSTIFIIVTAIAYCIKEFVLPILRNRRLRTPVTAHFVITSMDRFNLGYAIQDDIEHFTKELVLPSHTDDVFLHFILIARDSFEQNNFELSFEENRDSKPLIKYWFLPFVKVGTKEKKPGEAPGHYIDYHDNYHIDETRHRAKKQTIVYGFRITTRDPGIYTMKTGITADGIDGSTTLIVRVEDKPRTPMRCETHSGCFVTPIRPA